MKYICLISTLFLLISCKKEEKSLKFIKNIEFKNSLNANYRFGGAFKEKDSTIIFFADIATKKKIYFHNAKGALIDSISFNNPNLLNDEYNTLNFINRDTFFIGNKFNIIALNKECKIIKQISRDSLLQNEPYNYHFHFSPFIQGKQLKDKFYVDLDWRGNKNMSIEEFNTKYEEYSFSNPNLLYISDFFSDKATYKMPYNYNSFIFNNPGSFSETFRLFYANNLFFKASDFTNKILVIKDSVKIIEFNSDYPSRYKAPKRSTIKIHNGASIQGLFHSKNKNKYIIVLRQSIDSSITEYKKYRPFSIITLDNNFKKTDEKAILDDSHQPYRSFYIEEQDILLIQKNTLNENKNIFSAFAF